MCQLGVRTFQRHKRNSVIQAARLPAAFHPSGRLTPRPCHPTDRAGRTGLEKGRLGPQPGPAGPVHRLAGEGTDQNGQQHEEVPHRDPAPFRQVSRSLSGLSVHVWQCLKISGQWANM